MVIARAWLLALALAWPMQPLDDAVRTAVQSHRDPALERPMHLVSDLGRPLLLLTGAVALVSGAAGRALLVEAGVVLVPVNLAVESLKWVTWRARPDGTHRHGNAAFPSSHAANAFAVAVLLARRWRRAWPAWFALAALVGWSRIWLDRHWLSDVVTGALLGALLAWGALLALQRWRASRAVARTA